MCLLPGMWKDSRLHSQNTAQSIQPVSFRNAMYQTSTALFCGNYDTSRVDNRPVAAGS